MNHLAHAVLAGDDDLAIAGGLLGDFWRGAPEPSWPDALKRGVLQHRRIDSHIDAHPRVVAARRLFEPPMRRYAGIVLDVWWDHVLARDFPRYIDGLQLDTYVDRVDAALAHVLTLDGATVLPPSFVLFATRTRRHRTLARYAERDFLDDVFEHLSQRLARSNPIAHALPAIAPHEGELARHFEAFWPDLRDYARAVARESR